MNAAAVLLELVAAFLLELDTRGAWAAEKKLKKMDVKLAGLGAASAKVEPKKTEVKIAMTFLYRTFSMQLHVTSLEWTV